MGVQQSSPLVLEVAVVPGRAGKSSLCIWKPGAFSGGLGSWAPTAGREGGREGGKEGREGVEGERRGGKEGGREGGKEGGCELVSE